MDSHCLRFDGRSGGDAGPQPALASTTHLAQRPQQLSIHLTQSAAMRPAHITTGHQLQIDIRDFSGGAWGWNDQENMRQRFFMYFHLHGIGHGQARTF